MSVVFQNGIMGYVRLRSIQFTIQLFGSFTIVMRNVGNFFQFHVLLFQSFQILARYFSCLLHPRSILDLHYADAQARIHFETLDYQVL